MHPQKVSLDKERLFFLRSRFNEKFKVTACLVLSCLLIFMDAHLHKLDEIKLFVGSSLRPIQEFVFYLLDAPYKTVTSFYNAIDNQKKIDELSLALFNKQIQEQEILRIRRENADLRKALALSKNEKRFPLITAKISQVSLNPLITSITIDKGQEDGILLASPVISSDGLLGQVTHLYDHYAEVSLINELHQNTPIEILPNHIRGIAFGAGEHIYVKFLSRSSGISPGNPVVTSGLDGIYPQNTPVGTISSVETDKNGDVTLVEMLPSATKKVPSYVSVLLPHHKLNLGQEKFWVAYSLTR